MLTAQYWGKGDTRTIEKVMGIALRFSLIVAAVFFLAAEAVPELIMRLFTGDEAVVGQGAVYLRIVAPSYLFSSVTMVYLNIMRSVERVVVSMVVFLISLLQTSRSMPCSFSACSVCPPWGSPVRRCDGLRRLIGACPGIGVRPLDENLTPYP